MLHCILCYTDTLSRSCYTVFFVTQILYHFRVTLYSLLHRYFITFLLHCILCYTDTLSRSCNTVFFVTQILCQFRRTVPVARGPVPSGREHPTLTSMWYLPKHKRGGQTQVNHLYLFTMKFVQIKSYSFKISIVSHSIKCYLNLTNCL